MRECKTHGRVISHIIFVVGFGLVENLKKKSANNFSQRFIVAKYQQKRNEQRVRN